MRLRPATINDRDAIAKIHLSAFPAEERERVAKLALELLAETTNPATLSLVAEIDGAIVAHIAFSPVTIDGHDRCQGYILAPLGVKTGFQQRRIGSQLVAHGIRQLSAKGVNVVFVYGDPAYYGRFGFSAEAAEPYSPPYPLQYPFGWQALVLNECRFEHPVIAITCARPLRDPNLW